MTYALIFALIVCIGVIVYKFFLEESDADIPEFKQDPALIFAQNQVTNSNKQIIGLNQQLNNLQNDINKLQEERKKFVLDMRNEYQDYLNKEIENFKSTELIRIRAEEKELALSEANVKLDNYVKDFEAEVRKDAVKKSKEVLKGKNFEQFVPFLEGSEYNPNDFRFLGSPIDFIIFNGLQTGELKDIIFCEVKSGRAKLSGREKMIRKVVEEKRISYLELRENLSEPKEIKSEENLAQKD